LFSSGNVANRFRPMNAVLILYQFILLTPGAGIQRFRG
jgi:hypothetical protein